MPDESDDEVVEYDLTDWDDDTRTSLEWMLRGRNVVFEWEQPGVLVVQESAEGVVDEFVAYLSTGPVELEVADDEIDTEPIAPGEWIPLEDFYAANPVRSESEEVQFGANWKDEEDIRHEVHWVQDTGEVYLLGVLHKWIGPNLVVEIVGTLRDRDDVERALFGWEQAMTMDNSVAWVREQIAAAQALPDDEEPAADEPRVLPLE